MLNKLYHKGAEIKSAFLNGVKVFEVFDPLSLFDGGKKGVWYDPSDITTLFQDVEGTVPVTKDGDPVALMKNKAGNGNHAVQTVSAARPVYKTNGVLHWLRFDGVDDYLLVQPFAVSLHQPFTYLSSSNRNTDSINNTIISGTKLAERIFIFESTSATSIRAGYSDAVRGVLPLSSESKLLYVLANGSSSKVRDKDKNIQTVRLGNVSYNNIVISATDANSGYMNQDIYSIIIVGAAHDFNVKIGNYLSAKAGVTL